MPSSHFRRRALLASGSAPRLIALGAVVIAQGSAGPHFTLLVRNNPSSKPYDSFEEVTDADNIATLSTDEITITTTTVDTHQIVYKAVSSGGRPDLTITIDLAITDQTAPTVSTYSPADNATDVAIDATLTATFDETVVLGASGVITLKRTSDDATIDTWDVATDGGSGAGQVEVLTNTALTLHLTTDLTNEIEYYVVWDAGVVEDGAGNPVAALSSTTTWSFTTESSVTFELAGLDNIYAAGGTKRVLEAYTGNLIRVREDGGDTEQDFTYGADGWVDKAAITTFLNGANGFVTTIYDQSGNARNWTQVTTTAQPALNMAATQVAIEADGTNHYMINASILGFARASTGVSIVVVRKPDTTTGDHVSFYHNSSGSSARILIGQEASFTNQHAGGRTVNADAFARTTGFAPDTAWGVQISRFDYANALLKHRVNANTETLNPFQDAETSQNSDASANGLFGRGNDGGLKFNGQLTLIACFSDLLTDPEDTALAAIDLDPT